MRDWLRLAFSWPVARRALQYGVIVGLILILIKHWDALLTGGLGPSHYVKMVLTFCVPYGVSTLSSVGATLESRNQTGISRGAN